MGSNQVPSVHGWAGGACRGNQKGAESTWVLRSDVKGFHRKHSARQWLPLIVRQQYDRPARKVTDADTKVAHNCFRRNDLDVESKQLHLSVM